MKKLAVIGLVMAAAACQPQPETASRGVTVTDAVLTRQSSREDNIRTQVVGTWTCKAIASGIDITTQTTYRSGGNFQATMLLAGDLLNLSVGVEGKWALVNGGQFQQSFTSVGKFTGTLGGEPITPQDAASLGDAIRQLSPDPEAINISEHKFTLTDGEGTVTTCTR